MIHEYERRERERKENSLEEESCEWFNLMVEKFWPTLSIMLNGAIKRWLEANLVYARPSSIDKFDVTSVSVGPVPPLFSHMRGIRVDRENCLWVAEFDVLWHPDAEVGLTAHLATLPGESSNGLFKVPVKLKDMSCDGRMQLSLRFIPDYPYLDVVQVAFKTRPQIDLGVQLLNVVEIMDISFLSETLTQSLNNAISQYLVLPHSVRVSLKFVAPTFIAISCILMFLCLGLGMHQMNQQHRLLSQSRLSRWRNSESSHPALLSGSFTPILTNQKSSRRL
jgi:Ca2+-dependent lipid-binding protein